MIIITTYNMLRAFTLYTAVSRKDKGFGEWDSGRRIYLWPPSPFPCEVRSNMKSEIILYYY